MFVLVPEEDNIGAARAHSPDTHIFIPITIVHKIQEARHGTQKQ